MNCTEFDNLLGGYMEHAIPQTQRDAIDAHRARCRRCADLFRVAHEITCREIAEFLDDYVEGRLAPDRRTVFERHLAICSDCETYLDGYRRTMKLVCDCAEAGPPSDMPADLVAAILAARGRRPGKA